MKNIIIPPLIERKCPIWTERIRSEQFTKLRSTEKVIREQLTDLNHRRYCLVAECYLFTDMYADSSIGNELFCFDCEIFSGRIYNSHNIKQFQFILNEFAEHLEQKHLKDNLK